MAAALREPEHWVEDTQWHRRMYAQSMFRWAPEDPVTVALRWTRGRVVFETPGHLRLLDRQLLQLRDFAAQIDDIMAGRLRLASKLGSSMITSRCLELISMTADESALLRWSAPPDEPPRMREADRVLAGIPVPNPFTQIWELRQLRSMYTAADNLLEDAYCDLAAELFDAGTSWDRLAQVTSHFVGTGLQMRVQEQRELRGEPGDPRRVPEQRY